MHFHVAGAKLNYISTFT